jgi:hypothetical protein
MGSLHHCANTLRSSDLLPRLALGLKPVLTVTSVPSTVPFKNLIGSAGHVAVSHLRRRTGKLDPTITLPDDLLVVGFAEHPEGERIRRVGIVDDPRGVRRGLTGCDGR